MPCSRMLYRGVFALLTTLCVACNGPIVGNGSTDGGSVVAEDCVMPDASAGFAVVSVASAVTKVKTLLVGLPPTEAEVSAVAADPNALNGLITQWMALPQYGTKMLHFFESAFQQDQFTYDDLVFQFAQFQLFTDRQSLIVQNLQESFARTAMELIAEGQPFTATMTTRRYMMTTAVAAAYAILDNISVDDSYMLTDLFAQNHPSQVTVESTQPLSIDQSIDPSGSTFLTFYDPSIAMPYGTGCPTGTIIYPSPAPYQSIASLLYSDVPWFDVTHNQVPCLPPSTSSPSITQADFTNWQMVTVRPPNAGESTTPIYDIPSMRAGHDLVMNIPRVSFFTTPAFFARWPTNDSNVARVLINQTMIVALGTPIDLTNPSVPADLSAVDTTHATPGTQCYGCHVSLDPMRQFFRQTYTLYGSTQTVPAQLAMPGQFAFHGVLATGTHGITDLGAQLAAHPLFATSWVQRLCTYATSAPCLETDPEFVRLVNLFVSSNYSWNALVQALFASPLVTYLAPTLTTALAGPTFPVTRQEHLCALLSSRLGVTDICGLDVTTTTGASHVAQALAPSWPSGQYSRGDPTPALAVNPTLLLRGGLENICTDLANTYVVTGASSMFPVEDPTVAIENIVTRLMGLTGDRVGGVQAILQQHYNAAVASHADSSTALQSTFVLGCLSPYVAGMGQ